MKAAIEKIQPRKRRIPVPAQVAIGWIVVYLFLKLFIKPPLPSSLIFMYMTMTSIGFLMYVSVYEDVLQEVKGPIADFLRGDPFRAGLWWVARWVLLVAVPVYVGYLVYQRVTPREEPPLTQRVIHPAPPAEVMGMANPLRQQPEKYGEYIQEGMRIYYSNCVFCHGDALNGKGIYASGLNPPPADFVDPGTIAQLQESFVFWRVSEGGPGLPSESAPWDSAMPRWKEMLSQEERWKVILFLYDYTGYSPRTWETTTVEQKSTADQREKETVSVGGDLKQGKIIYEKRCAHCHGVHGDGRGPAAAFLNPPPLAFTEAKYRYASTFEEELPTDDDLFRTVSRGLPGTAMPAWENILTEKERRQVIQYIKTFSPRFAEATELPRKIPMGKPIPSSSESIAKGKEIYLKSECNECHGDQGRGDGPEALKIKRRVRNLTQRWLFRGGGAPADIFLRTARGLFVMPPFDDLTEEERWHLVNFVRSLSADEAPRVMDVLKAKKWDGDLPTDPHDPRWQRMEEGYYSLIGQVIKEPRLFTPSIPSIRVSAVYNDREIALRLVWDDQTHTRRDPADPEVFDDAVEVQFPVTITENQKPYFLRGDEQNPVNLWRWGSGGKVREFNYWGFDREVIQPESSQELKAAGTFEQGQYRAVIKRPFETADKEHDIQFKVGKFIPMAFSARDGSNGEIGTEVAISAWFYLYLEPPTPRTIYVYPMIGILITVGAEWWIIRRLRKRP